MAILLVCVVRLGLPADKLSEQTSVIAKPKGLKQTLVIARHRHCEESSDEANLRHCEAQRAEAISCSKARIAGADL